MKQATSSVSSPRKLDLEVADLMTLAPHEWLNDNVLNGYFDLLSEARPDDVYCFNTFFYTQLCRKGYQGVRRWTRKVQIFQKSVLLVPLHLGNHWCLAEVAVQDKLLFLYDSRGGANLTCLQRLVSYLCCEAEERGEADFTSGWEGHFREDIPVQETSGDCGVFVCQYARCIMEGRPMDFSQKDMPKFRCQMTQELLQHKLL
ncbi:PREDICTED: sentrin-specific protease 5-like [Branchiostoma belcheri]|uniref:Sentrin-specific protease 5-like n=1 Tax=Branchiostoma belcheri TaxID=7741 RepID=A0A6P5A602_BRABE|nr:PREDICTED: sentrin-specific protease 5-like [Branchiostoma belcheri]